MDYVLFGLLFLTISSLILFCIYLYELYNHTHINSLIYNVCVKNDKKIIDNDCSKCPSKGLCIKSGISNYDLLNFITSKSEINKCTIVYATLIIIVLLFVIVYSTISKITESFIDRGFSIFEEFEEDQIILRLCYLIIIVAPFVLFILFRNKALKMIKEEYETKVKELEDETQENDLSILIKQIKKSINLFEIFSLISIVIIGIIFLILLIKPKH